MAGSILFGGEWITTRTITPRRGDVVRGPDGTGRAANEEAPAGFGRGLSRWQCLVLTCYIVSWIAPRFVVAPVVTTTFEIVESRKSNSGCTTTV